MAGANRSRLRDEAGYMIIEIVVTASLVAVVSLGLFAGFDGATATSTQSKSRAIGVTLAQQDQERLRGFTARDLSNKVETRTLTVAGVDYTVESRAIWVSDTTGTSGCISTGARSDYQQITSTVTWAKMGHLQPIVLQSLAAPPPGSFTATEGTLAIQIRDRNGAGVSGVPVSVTGPASYTDTTTSLGCVSFGFLPVGTYTITFSKTGYVDRQGVNAMSATASVTSQTTTVSAFEYDLAGQIVVTGQTRLTGLGSNSAAKLEYIWLGHSGIQPSGRIITAVSPAATPFTLTNVFPATTAYGVYSGDCTGSAPNLAPNTGAMPSATVPPGGSVNVTVLEPALDVLLKDGATNQNGGKVSYKRKSSGCTATVLGPLTTDSTGHPVDPTAPAANQNDGVALPYGTYDVCGVNAAKTKKWIKVNHLVTTTTAATALTIDTNAAATSPNIKTTGTNLTCP